MCTAQVDQYHEEAGGQRTVVRLGEFSSTSKLPPKIAFFGGFYIVYRVLCIVPFSGIEEVLILPCA